MLNTITCVLILEGVPQPQLQDARIAGAGDPAEQTGAERGSRVAEVDAVQRIETFYAELDLVALREWHGEGFKNRKIEIRVARPHKSIAPQYTERARRIRRNRGGVEPFLYPCAA